MKKRLSRSALYGALTTIVTVFLSQRGGFGDMVWMLPGVLIFVGMTAMAYRFVFDHIRD